MIGGKYTGFRAVARRVLDRAYPDRRSLGLDPEVRRKRDANLPGAPSGDFGRYVDIRGKEIAAKHGTSPERARAILARFGTDGERILSSDGAEPSAIGPYEELGTDPPLLLAELAHMVQNEFVHTIADVVRRRTALWMGVDFGRPAARIVGEALVRHHGFDRGRIDSEIEAWERQAEDEERLLAEVS